MSRRQLLLPLLLALALPVCARAQDSHVHAEYVEDLKGTRVYTDFLHLADSPDHFLMVQLLAGYPGRQLTAPPRVVVFDIGSVSRRSRYRLPLLVIADGERFRLDNHSYQMFEGETKDGKEQFWFCPFNACQTAARLRGHPDFPLPRQGRAVEIPLPADAQVRGGKGVNGLYLEHITAWVKSEQFVKIAGAQKVELAMGPAKFILTEKQKEIVRDFARRLSP